jgi:hypothetical protein
MKRLLLWHSFSVSSSKSAFSAVHTYIIRTATNGDDTHQEPPLLLCYYAPARLPRAMQLTKTAWSTPASQPAVITEGHQLQPAWLWLCSPLLRLVEQAPGPPPRPPAPLSQAPVPSRVQLRSFPIMTQLSPAPSRGANPFIMPVIIKAALAAAPQQSWPPPGVVPWGGQLELL